MAFNPWHIPMKRPPPNPHSRRVPPRLAPAPDVARLSQYERFAEYVGSGEHKSAPWNGKRPATRRERHASRCPGHLTQEQATRMLKAGIRAGNISEDFDGQMPRRVWYKGSLGIFEARLTDRADIEAGKPAGYKGWPEDAGKLPHKPRKIGPCDEV